MICSQCGELLVEDRFMDWTARWRCLKCGHVQDSDTVQSYLARQENDFFSKHSKPDYCDEEIHLGSESFVGPLLIARPGLRPGMLVLEPTSTDQDLERDALAPAHGIRVGIGVLILLWSVIVLLSP